MAGHSQIEQQMNLDMSTHTKLPLWLDQQVDAATVVGSKHSTFEPTAKFLPTEVHFTVCSFTCLFSCFVYASIYEADSNPASVLALSVQQSCTVTS